MTKAKPRRSTRSGRRRSAEALATEAVRATPPAGREVRPEALSLAWLGVVPFFAYTLALPVPARGDRHGRRVPGRDGRLHVRQRPGRRRRRAVCGTPTRTSIEISLVTALLGGLLGFLIAYAAIRDGTPRWIRSAFTTFSGVAANFGGIPLAFAFIATLGTIGIVTQFLANQLRLRTRTTTGSRSSGRRASSSPTSTSRSR